MVEIEGCGVDLLADPGKVWTVSNIPILFRGVLVASPVSGEAVAAVIDEYGQSCETLQDVCNSYGVKMALLLKLADQYPLISDELNFAEKCRARLLESKALEGYTGTIEETMQHIEETRIDKHGEQITIASAAKVAQLKARSERLYKAAAIADRKRYGEKESDGTTINILNQQNAGGGGPVSFEELQTISVTALLDRQPPGQS